VLARLPHPSRGFTQGLLVLDGQVLESTGLYAQSDLRRYPPGTTAIAASVPLPPELFGESICQAGNVIWQLTWRERVALRWDPVSLAPLGQVPYNREGWGICAPPGAIFTSDGSSELIRREPAGLEPAGLIRVRFEGSRVDGLNDLAWDSGRIWANLAQRPYLAGIDPGTGEVTDLVDASAAWEKHRGDPDAILNGIAVLPGAGEFLLAGKGWRHLYHVRFIPAKPHRNPLRLLAG
jgi:glutamine cyclotransferase